VDLVVWPYTRDFHAGDIGLNVDEFFGVVGTGEHVLVLVDDIRLGGLRILKFSDRSRLDRESSLGFII